MTVFCILKINIQCSSFWRVYTSGFSFSLPVVAKSCIVWVGHTTTLLERLGTSFGLVAMAKMPMPILYCLRQSHLAPEKLILNLFVLGLYEKSTTIQVLDVTPFLECWLIRPGKCTSIRLFRQTTVIYPHRHFCVTKRFGEEECDAQAEWWFFTSWANSWIVCIFLRFWKGGRRRRNDFKTAV